MRILVNCSTINVGGGFFATVNFISEALTSSRGSEFEWYFILNAHLIDALQSRKIVMAPDQYLLIESSPTRFFSYYRISRLILDYEKNVKPDLVYSIGSPSFLFFSAPEVQRLTNPWITHPNLWAYLSLPLARLISEIFKLPFQRFFVSRGKFFITQSLSAKKAILQISKTSNNHIRIVKNTLSPVFIGQPRSRIQDVRSYIFCLSAAYFHKNLHLLPKIAYLLKSQTNEDFCFVITIPFENPIYRDIKKNIIKYHVEGCIINLGPITQFECIQWYRKSAVVFLPTYLETFSVTLLEAAYFGLPTVTTDFFFNTDVLKNSGIYFKPGSLKSAVSKLITALDKGRYRDPDTLISDDEFKSIYGDYSDTFSQTVDFFESIKVDVSFPYKS